MPALWLASGCTTMRLEDTLPATAESAPASSAPAQGTLADAGPEGLPRPTDAPPAYGAETLPPRPTTRGGYPNLNIRPPTANDQLTEAERREKTSELESARQRLNRGADAPARAAPDPQQMRRDARQRERDTLRRIEGR